MAINYRAWALLPAEKAAAVYCAATSVLMVIMMPQLVDPAGMLMTRVGWLAATLGVIALQRITRPKAQQSAIITNDELQMTNKQNLRKEKETLIRHSSFVTHHSSIFSFLRILVQLAWLSMWYPDTYEFNRSLPNLDHVFAAAEQSIFGCQPSIEFSQLLPGAVWSEAFNLGYWSYFPMIAALSIAVFWIECRKRQFAFPRFHRVVALIMISFFLYYVIYIFLPVTGPQFYFQAVGVDQILQGHFPAVGTYFSSHTEMLPSPGWSDGLFYQLVEMAHEAGERPTAAFPSSHIGISTILLLLARRHAPRVLPFLLPLWALLCCATVYIQAHYLIDAIAGLISAPIILCCSQYIMKKATSRPPASCKG